MADRDVEVDILLRDKTSPGVKSTERNIKRVGDQGNKVTAQLNKGFAQWGRGFSKVGGAAHRWASSGDSAGKKFVRGIGSGLGKLAELGGSVGGGLSKAVSSAGPQVALAMSAVLVSAAVAAGPAVAGAIVGGAGLGGVVGGVLIASQDARVAGAFDDLKETVGTQLQTAAGRFVPATLDAVKRAKGLFAGMLPSLRRIFDVSATWLGPLTDRIGRGAQAALSGIAAAVTKAGPVISVVGEGIQRLLAAVGDGFRMLSDNGAAMGLALKGVFLILEVGVRGVFFMLNLLTEAFEKVARFVPGLSGKLKELENSQDGAKTSAFNLSGGFQALAGDANGAAAGITNVRQKADEFVNSNISLARAQIASRDAVRNATDAIKENAKAKMSNKERADANMTSLLNLADAFNTETEAGDKSGISAGKAAAAYSTNRAKLIAMAEKAGFSKTKAAELAAQLLKTPKNVNTNINVNTGPATTKLETFMKQVRKADGTVANVTVQVTTKGDHRIPGVGTQVRRWGGIDHHMARGGMLAAHFTSSPTVLYGERETGGEAFIPRRGDLGRSRSIAETVVRDWLGGEVAWGGRGQAVAAGPEVLNLTLDLGHGIQQVVQINLREHNRGLKRRVGAGAGR
ncbi:hypothetical protein ABZ807_09480 [Micromonospora sp. NPDC047548]|uniref:hypothetical protein n=1 Tax=Micromonospora sp. NPDC047548 TaxID=3155624 RepID=UPI0033E290DA